MKPNLFVTTRELAVDLAARAALSATLLMQRDELLKQVSDQARTIAFLLRRSHRLVDRRRYLREPYEIDA